MVSQTPPGNEDNQFTFETILDGAHRSDSSTATSHGEFLDSQSLTDSIIESRRENGRTYHSYHAGSYHFPNDPPEAERLNLQYAVLKGMLGQRNYLAPFSQANPPRRVLDIATGTGAWCLDMGDEFPDARITGTDLSPTIMPEFASPNVYFNVDNSALDWEPSFHGLDYIHTRVTMGCWEDMKRDIIQRAFDHLAPGGYLECQEISSFIECDDGTMPETYPIREIFAELTEIARIEAHRPLDVAEHLRAWFEEVGFVDVHQEVFRVPLNGWPRDEFMKEIGNAWKWNVSTGLPAFSLALLSRFREMTEAQIQVRLVDVRRSLQDRSVHAHEKFYVVWGRKPDPSKQSDGTEQPPR